jgi:hypothetical protein
VTGQLRQLEIGHFASRKRDGFLTERLGHPLPPAQAARREVIEQPYAGEWPARVRFAFRFRPIGV